jgi:hypothetical protein
MLPRPATSQTWRKNNETSNSNGPNISNHVVQYTRNAYYSCNLTKTTMKHQMATHETSQIIKCNNTNYHRNIANNPPQGEAAHALSCRGEVVRGWSCRRRAPWSWRVWYPAPGRTHGRGGNRGPCNWRDMLLVPRSRRESLMYYTVGELRYLHPWPRQAAADTRGVPRHGWSGE